jgi:hypothetical protein
MLFSLISKMTLQNQDITFGTGVTLKELKRAQGCDKDVVSCLAVLFLFVFNESSKSTRF